MANAEARLRALEKTRAPAVGAAPTPTPLLVPDVITFATSPEYLGLDLYPAQGTLLKIIFLETDLLTDFDRDLIARWESGFHLVTTDGGACYAGTMGIAPGTLERMQACKALGRRWFREVVLVLGRRAGKGFLGGVVVAYLLWHLLATGNPQAHFSMARNKLLTIPVFAGEQSQAAANQFRDIAETIREAPCFQPFLAGDGPDWLRLCSPADLDRAAARPDRSARPSLLVRARATTSGAGRGPASPALIIDEMAHMATPGLTRSGDAVYEAAVPALAQFGTFALTYLASSPRDKIGQFYAAHQRALATDAAGAPTDPTSFTAQLPSYATYEGWEKTRQGLTMFPGGPDFATLDRPMVADDDTLRARQRENPHSYAVEYLAQWWTSQDAYLDPDHVHAVFAPYLGAPLTQKAEGRYDTDYVMHLDPAYSGANFAAVIAHGEPESDSAVHVVVDHIAVFRPQDFHDGKIDYEDVVPALARLIEAFGCLQVTTDQYNEVVIPMLEKQISAARLPRRPTIYKRQATRARNWSDAETFKTAIALGLVHAPEHTQARNELLYLQERTPTVVDHPTSGPVQTSDIADCMFAVTAELLGKTGTIMEGLSGLRPLGTTLGRPMPHSPTDLAVLNSFASARRSTRDQPQNPARTSHWARRGSR